jgi:amino acid permease
VSYIVFVKSLLPQLLIKFVGEENTPTMLGDGQWSGQIFWATIYLIFVLFPLALSRKAGSLEYFSFLGFFATIYLVTVIVVLFFADRSLVPDMGENIKEAKYFHVTYDGMINSIPFVIFALMYQPSIPMVYRELKVRTYSNMNKVVIIVTVVAVVIYIIASTFGYLDLVSEPEGLNDLLEGKNILEVDFGNLAFTIAVCFLLFPVIAIAPFLVLLAKDDTERIIFKDNSMSKKQNVIITI